MFFFARISFQVPSSSLEFCQLLPLNMGSFTIITHEAATILAASIPLILLQQQGLQCTVKSKFFLFSFFLKKKKQLFCSFGSVPYAVKQKKLLTNRRHTWIWGNKIPNITAE